MLKSSCRRISDNLNIKDTGWAGRRRGACSVLVGVVGGGPLVEIGELLELSQKALKHSKFSLGTSGDSCSLLLLIDQAPVSPKNCLWPILQGFL